MEYQRACKPARKVRAANVLTEQEFQEQKRRLLDRSGTKRTVDDAPYAMS